MTNEIKCLYCGFTLTDLTPSQLKTRKFCNKDCSSRYQKISTKGENHPNWKEEPNKKTLQARKRADEMEKLTGTRKTYIPKNLWEHVKTKKK